MIKFELPGSLSNIRDYQLFKDYALHTIQGIIHENMTHIDIHENMTRIGIQELLPSVSLHKSE